MRANMAFARSTEMALGHANNIRVRASFRPHLHIPRIECTHKSRQYTRCSFQSAPTRQTACRPLSTDVRRAYHALPCVPCRSIVNCTTSVVGSLALSLTPPSIECQYRVFRSPTYSTCVRNHPVRHSLTRHPARDKVYSAAQ